jgi:hypothetical protein
MHFVDGAGKPHHEYTNYPFTKAPIISFIARSNTYIVIIKLRLTDDGYQTFGVFGGQSQSSALNLSQSTDINSFNGFSQLSFSQNPMDGMWVGFPGGGDLIALDNLMLHSAICGLPRSAGRSNPVSFPQGNQT